MEHRAYFFFSKKITLKHVWIVLGKLLGIFGILKIFFFENFRRLDIPWKTGQKIFKKFAPKHVQYLFRYFWERFWAFLNFENFLIFKKIFEDSSLHRTLGKNFSNKLSQITIKTRLDSFGNNFGRFWNFESFFDFFENFLRFETPWKTGQKNFRKACPKTRSKHVWILLGTILGIFGILKKNILKIFENSTLHGTLGIKFFKKFSPKHVQNTFGYFWEHFWAFLEF